MTRGRKLRLGDVVREHDGCHEGRIVFIDGYTTRSRHVPLRVRVRWLDTGWKTDFAADELILVEA